MSHDQFPWTIQAYQMSAQTLMAILMRERGFARGFTGTPHWGNLIEPVSRTCAMVAVEAHVRGQTDWPTIYQRLRRDLYYFWHDVSNLFEQPELMVRGLYQRTYEEMTQPLHWQIVTESAEYYDNTPHCRLRELEPFVKRSLKVLRARDSSKH